MKKHTWITTAALLTTFACGAHACARVGQDTPDAVADTTLETLPDVPADQVDDGAGDVAWDLDAPPDPDVLDDIAVDTPLDPAPDTSVDTTIDPALDTSVDTTLDPAPDTAVDTVVDSGVDTTPDAVDVPSDGTDGTCSEPFPMAGPGLYTADTTGALSLHDPSCSGWQQSSTEHVWLLTLASAATVVFGLHPTAHWDPSIYVHHACEVTSATTLDHCADENMWGLDESLTASLAAGEWYVFVDGYISSGPYELTVAY